MSENKTNRDYKHEHAIRAKKNKRFACDINKEKAEQLEAMLKEHNITFSEWIKNHINQFIKEGK